jgi:parallel beta-helix repeat protein
MKKLLPIFAVILLISLSAGRTLVVDQEGTGDSKTLAGALALAATGDNIMIKAGSYEGATINRAISLSGTPSSKIIGSNGAALVVNASGCKISNISFEGGTAPVLVLSSSSNLLFGCAVQGSGAVAGISILGANNTITDSRISSGTGIDLVGSQSKIFNVTIGGDLGIKINGTFGNVIKGCRIQSATGIKMQSSNDNTIESNSLSGMQFGIEITASKGNRVNDNQLSGSYLSGMDIVESSGVSLSNNSIQGGKLGISLRRSSGNKLINNTCKGNERAGIYTDGSSANEISDNDLSHNGNGLLIANSKENTILANDASGNTYGISLRGAVGNTLQKNLMTANDYNLRVDEGEISSAALAESGRDFFNQEIDDSNLADGRPVCYIVNKSDLKLSSSYGFVGLIGCRNIMVSDQVISNSSAGVLVVNSTRCRVENSRISECEEGVYLLSSRLITLKNCTSESCNRGILSTGTTDGVFEKDLESNCTGDGLRLEDAQNITIRSSGVLSSKEGIMILSSRLCNLLDCKVEWNKGTGIVLSSSQKCILRGNDVSSNDRGIALSGSNACILSNNNAHDNVQDGLSLQQLSSAEVIGNTATGNGQGLFIQSSKKVSVKGNMLCKNSRYGLRMSSSTGCNITDNNITANSLAGANLVDCNGNFIYHNIFMDNGLQNAADNGANQWDAGPKVGGNYWSDHPVNGNPGNVQRSIPSSGTDRYPFQSQNGWR